jgi:hypothetical protein
MKQFASYLLLLVAGVALSTAGCSRGTYAGPVPKRDVAEKIRGGGEGGGGAQTTVAKSTGTGWATLKGVFTLNGAAPNLPGLSTGGKDGNVCGQQVVNQALVVDPSTKGIANIVIFARKVSRIHPDLAKPSQTPEIFDQKACLFLSHVMAIRVGQPMDVKNSDPIGHNTNINPPPNKPENFLLSSNQVVPYTYTAALTVPSPIVCNIHPWMKAYLIARDDPYFAVTKPDGSFEIKNLPAGEDIEFQVWHESAGGIGGSGGPLDGDKSWSKGRFKKKLAEGSEEKLEVAVPVSAF